MTDPFSIAAGVAGLVALAGTTSKTFYQFFRSIYDAPDDARNLATALYTLNIALSQLQQCLLDPKFVRVGDDDQITAIEDCLASCTAAFDTIRARIEASGFSSNEQTFPRKAWEAVKASFNEQQMKDCLNRIEREKTTLTLIVGVFSMRLDAGIMAHVRETKALAQKTDRRLKDIHIFCQWIVAADTANGKKTSTFPSESIQTTAFPLSSAYEASEIQRLLQSSGSVLSLTLGGMDEDSVTAICRPEPQSEVPLKRIVSTIGLGRPAKDSEGLFRSKVRTIPLSLESFDDTVSALKNLAGHRCLPRNQDRLKAMSLFLQAVKMGSGPPGISVMLNPMLAPYAGIFRMAQKAAELSGDIHDDLQYLERSYLMLSRHWIDGTADEILPPLLKDVANEITKYLQWANKIMTRDQVGRKGLQQDLKSAMRAGPDEAERKRLKKSMVTAVEAARDAQSTLGSVKMCEMQRQQLVQQEQITKQLQMLVDKQKNTEQPQKQDGRGSRERSSFTPSEMEHTTTRGDIAAGEDSPIKRSVQSNEEDSNASRDKEPRSPLQKLQIKLNNISKEEKRARVQEAEQQLRETQGYDRRRSYSENIK